MLYGTFYTGNSSLMSLTGDGGVLSNLQINLVVGGTKIKCVEGGGGVQVVLRGKMGVRRVGTLWETAFSCQYAHTDPGTARR